MKERFLCNRVFSLVLLAAAVLIGGFLPQVKSAHAATVYASGTISTATTWVSTNTYVIQTSLLITSGGSLTINSSTVVKIYGSAYIDVEASGTLNAQGASDGKIYFTSTNDNSVGNTISGSTGNPVRGDSGYIRIDSGASTTIDNG